MNQRLCDATVIFRHGASNPSGIAHSLLRAIEEVKADANLYSGISSITTDAACRAIVYQLATVFGIEPLAYGVSVDLALTAASIANPPGT